MFVQQLRSIGSGAMEETGILAVHSAGLHHQHLEADWIQALSNPLWVFFYLFINITSLFDFAVDPHINVQLGLTVPYEAMSFLQNVKETKP